MKARTLVELLTLSSNLYLISKDKEMISKLHSLADSGKEKINAFMSSSVKDKDGNEMEFLEKLALKAHEVKDELETKISEMAEALYKKMNIVHANEIKVLVTRIEELNKTTALLEARLNKLENK